MAESTPSSPDFQTELDQLTVLQGVNVTDLSAREHAGVQPVLSDGLDAVGMPRHVSLQREATLGDLSIHGGSGHGDEPLPLPSAAPTHHTPIGSGVADPESRVEQGVRGGDATVPDVAGEGRGLSRSPADEPLASDGPSVTDALVVTDGPLATEAPSATEAPLVTDAPLASDGPFPCETVHVGLRPPGVPLRGVLGALRTFS
ncbi:MAG: hypothetical protein H7837_13180, partial [Magnetococcus sp. MYC-9]